MATNFLEQLVSEWYEYKHFFVRRNVKVGKRSNGGYDCELDVVAFNPETKELIHVEPSMDSDDWATRERRYSKKFELGRRHIPDLFKGLEIPTDVKQIALLVYASNANRESLGGGKLVHVREFLVEIYYDLRKRRISNDIVPESFPVLRGLQFTAEYWNIISAVMKIE